MIEAKLGDGVARLEDIVGQIALGYSTGPGHLETTDVAVGVGDGDLVIALEFAEPCKDRRAGVGVDVARKTAGPISPGRRVCSYRIRWLGRNRGEPLALSR
ncbi:MAG: hypothetical protein R2705_22750 [Ilumatobacteraceae bacterium]